MRAYIFLTIFDSLIEIVVLYKNHLILKRKQIRFNNLNS